MIVRLISSALLVSLGAAWAPPFVSRTQSTPSSLLQAATLDAGIAKNDLFADVLKDLSPPNLVLWEPREQEIIEECPIEEEEEDIASFSLTWETDVAAKIRQDLQQRSVSSQDEPYMVSLVGGPGSGKSTSCQILQQVLQQQDVSCLVMPFDGYHVPMAQLEAQPNSADLIYRRGAPDTFDAHRLQTDLKRIKSGEEKHVPIPGFDHAKGDPEEGAHVFSRSHHQVVLCEGLYLLHDEDGWEDLKDEFDFKVYVDSNVNKCIESLKIRNQCIPGYTKEEILERCEVVDRTNAMTVDRSKARADLVVKGYAA